MKEVSPINVTLKYGAFNGIAAFILFIVLWKTGKNPLGTWSTLGWIIPIVFTFLTIREHRNSDLGGYITFGRALGTGMLLSIFAGFLFAVLTYACIVFAAPEIPQMQIDDFLANMERTKGLISEDKYNSIMATFEDTKKTSFTASSLALSTFEFRIIGGFIISLIAAAIYKRNRPPVVDALDIPEPNPN